MLKQVQHDGSMEIGEIRTDWTRDEIAALFDLPFTELVFRAAETHRAHHAPGEIQLCTLLSIKTGGCAEDCGYCSQSAHPQYGAQGRKADRRRCGDDRRARGEGGGIAAVLHGRRVARAQGSRHGRDRIDGLGRARPRHGNVHDFGHDRAAPGAPPRRGGARLLQPQYRHLARTLWRHHHDADLPGAARYARPCPRCGDGGVQRRDRRHGRDARRPRRLRPRARDAAAPPRKRAGQRARSRERHAAGRHARRYAARQDRRYRVRPHRRGRADHHAQIDGAASARAREHERGDAGLCFLAGANSIFTGDKLLTTGNRGDSADAALLAKLGLRAMESAEPMRAELEAAE